MRRESLGFRLLRLALAAVVIFAGVAKFGEPSQFYSHLLDLELGIPRDVIRLIAVSLPSLEIILGMALALNLWTETVRPMMVFLSLVFVMSIVQARIRGLAADCGCFGSAVKTSFATSLLRSLALLGAAITITIPLSEPQGGRDKPSTSSKN